MKGQLTVVWQRQLQKMHNGPRGGGREAEGGAGGCGLRRRKTRTKKQENRSHATVWAASGRCLRIFDACMMEMPKLTLSGKSCGADCLGARQTLLLKYRSGVIRTSMSPLFVNS